MREHRRIVAQKDIVYHDLLNDTMREQMNADVLKSVLIDSAWNDIDFDKLTELSAEELLDGILTANISDDDMEEEYLHPPQVDEEHIEKFRNENSGVSIMIDANALLARLMLQNPGDERRKISSEAIYGEIEQRGIRKGLKKSYIARLSQYPIYGKRLKIAQGKEPVHGEDGYVTFHFDVTKTLKPTLLEDGTVNYKEMHVAQSVKRGEVLCEIIPPSAGEDGVSVFGQVIPAKPGKAAKARAGKNTMLLQDKNQIVAACDGQVYLKDDTVCVERILTVKNVDASTGNITFVGTVVVRENVYAGFSVCAGGDIIVRGFVENSILNADGNITINGGINGSGEARIVAGSSVASSFIENAFVTAGKDIFAEVVLNSHLKANNKVEVLGKKGCIIGGSCMAGKKITADNIGNASEVPTALRLFYPDVAITQSELLAKAGNYEKLLDKMEIIILTQLKGDWLQNKTQTVVLRAIYISLLLEDEIMWHKNEAKRLFSETVPENPGRIQANYYLYTGVLIDFYGRKIRNKELQKGCTIKMDKGNMVLSKKTGRV